MWDLVHLFDVISGTPSPAKKSNGDHCTVYSPDTADNFLHAPFKKRPLSLISAEPASESKKLESSDLAGRQNLRSQIIKCLEMVDNTVEENETLRAELNKAKEELNAAKEAQVKMVYELSLQLVANEARVTAAEAAQKAANAIATAAEAKAKAADEKATAAEAKAKAAEADRDFALLRLKNLKEDWENSEATVQAATLQKFKTLAKYDAEREKLVRDFLGTDEGFLKMAGMFKKAVAAGQLQMQTLIYKNIRNKESEDFLPQFLLKYDLPELMTSHYKEEGEVVEVEKDVSPPPPPPSSSPSPPPLFEETDVGIQNSDWDFLRDENEKDEGRGRKRKKGDDDDDDDEEWTVEREKGKKVITRSRKYRRSRYSTRSTDSCKLKKDVGKDKPSAQRKNRTLGGFIVEGDELEEHNDDGDEEEVGEFKEAEYEDEEDDEED